MPPKKSIAKSKNVTAAAIPSKAANKRKALEPDTGDSESEPSPQPKIRKKSALATPKTPIRKARTPISSPDALLDSDSELDGDRPPTPPLRKRQMPAPTTPRRKIIRTPVSDLKTEFRAPNPDSDDEEEEESRVEATKSKEEEELCAEVREEVIESEDEGTKYEEREEDEKSEDSDEYTDERRRHRSSGVEEALRVPKIFEYNLAQHTQPKHSRANLQPPWQQPTSYYPIDISLHPGASASSDLRRTKITVKQPRELYGPTSPTAMDEHVKQMVRHHDFMNQVEFMWRKARKEAKEAGNFRLKRSIKKVIHDMEREKAVEQGQEAMLAMVRGVGRPRPGIRRKEARRRCDWGKLPI